MIGVQLLGLLLLKHAILAHVIDFGYSASRRAYCKYWLLALCFQILAELTGTLLVLNLPVTLHLKVVIAIECLGLTLATLVERRSSLPHLLRNHILCELTLLGLYVVMLALVL